MKPYTDFKDWHLEQLRDPEDARAYLQIALEEYEQDHDTQAFLLALRDVTEAQGGIDVLSRRSGLTQETLSRMLSERDAPPLDIMGTILHGLGYRLSVEKMSA